MSLADVLDGDLAVDPGSVLAGDRGDQVPPVQVKPSAHEIVRLFHDGKRSPVERKRGGRRGPGRMAAQDDVTSAAAAGTRARHAVVDAVENARGGTHRWSSCLLFCRIKLSPDHNFPRVLAGEERCKSDRPLLNAVEEGLFYLDLAFPLQCHMSCSAAEIRSSWPDNKHTHTSSHAQSVRSVIIRIL